MAAGASPAGAGSGSGRRVAHHHTTAVPTTSTPVLASAVRQPVAAAIGTVSDSVSIDPTLSAAV